MFIAYFYINFLDKVFFKLVAAKVIMTAISTTLMSFVIVSVSKQLTERTVFETNFLKRKTDTGLWTQFFFLCYPRAGGI